MITRTSWLSSLLGLVLAAGCAASSGAAGPPTPEPIHVVVLHTNDIHGQVLPRRATWLDEEPPPLAGGLPRLAAAVQRVRQEESSDVLVLDGGDWYQGTPEGMIDVGLSFVQGLSSIGYDAMSLGNHEFDHGLANVLRLLDEGGTTAVCANLYDPETGERVDWVAPWRIVEAGGLRVALIGLLTPETPAITHVDARRFEFRDPVEAFTLARAELGPSADLFVPVGHIGIETGRRLAEAHPDVPIVVTGHSHTFLDQGVRVGSTLVVQAGCKATVLGRVDLWLDPATAEVVRSEARLIDLLEEPAEAYRRVELEVLCSVLVEESEIEMSKVAGELTAAPSRRSLTGARESSTSAGNWICDVMRLRSGADVALHNRGGTRVNLEAGLISRRNLFELLPFDNDIVTMTLSGAQLEAVVRQSIEHSDHAALDYSGLTAFVHTEPARLVRIEVGGEPLDPEREYRVTTNSFLAGGGDEYEPLVEGGRRITDPVLMRDLMALYLEQVGRATPATDERIVVLPE